MKGHSIKGRDWIAIAILFMAALFLRCSFQAHSVVDAPVRADAAEYVQIAANLFNYGVYSSRYPRAPGNAPSPDFLRPPGYPLFLYGIMLGSDSMQEFIDRVGFLQALLGALGVVLLYAIARQFLGPAYAFVTGSLAAASPHLIAIDQYLLTESLFTFMSLLGAYLMIITIRLRFTWLFLVVGMVFGYLVLIKPAAVLLGPFLAIALALLRGRPNKELAAMIGLLLVGYSIVYAPYLTLRHDSDAEFNVSSQTVWDKVVMGSDIGLENFFANKSHPDKIAVLEKAASDRSYAMDLLREAIAANPLGAAGWYLGGKVLYLWKWDNQYNGDVYQYPMRKKGFDESRLLGAVHGAMRFLHWPLFTLTVLGILMAIGGIFRRQAVTDHYVLLLIPALVIIYYATLFTLLIPLPRYGIPLRPFSYVLAAFALKVLIDWARTLRTPDSTAAR